MNKQDVTTAGLEEMSDVRESGAHVDIAPGKPRPHATQYSDQGRTDIRTQDSELVSDAPSGCAKAACYAIGELRNLKIGEIAAVSRQRETGGMIACAQKIEIGDMHRRPPRA